LKCQRSLFEMPRGNVETVLFQQTNDFAFGFSEVHAWCVFWKHPSKCQHLDLTGTIVKNGVLATRVWHSILDYSKSIEPQSCRQSQPSCSIATTSGRIETRERLKNLRVLA